MPLPKCLTPTAKLIMLARHHGITKVAEALTADFSTYCKYLALDESAKHDLIEAGQLEWLAQYFARTTL